MLCVVCVCVFCVLCVCVCVREEVNDLNVVSLFSIGPIGRGCERGCVFGCEASKLAFTTFPSQSFSFLKISFSFLFFSPFLQERLKQHAMFNGSFSFPCHVLVHFANMMTGTQRLDYLIRTDCRIGHVSCACSNFGGKKSFPLSLSFLSLTVLNACFFPFSL